MAGVSKNAGAVFDLRPIEVVEGSGVRMSVRPGYKQTEVGVIPEDWSERTLGDLTTLMTNGFVGTAKTAYVESEDGVLYVQGYNVEPNGFNLNGIKRVSGSFHAKNQKSCLRIGDLLTIQTGDIGVTTIVPPVLEGANCHALVISRFDKRNSEPGYYCQYFNSEKGRSVFKEIETGSTMKHLNVGDMVKLLVPSPPLQEQRAIAEALSDVDELLAKLDQLIAKKRDLKQAAMQQLLTGQTRLPGFSEAWEVKTFGEVFDYLPTATNARSDLSDAGDTYYVHYGDIHTKFHSHLNFHDQRPPMILKELCTNAAYLKNGDWVMADASEDYNGIGKTIEISGLKESVMAVAGLHTFLLREKVKTFTEGFKGHLGNLNSLHQQYLRVATGMKVFGVSKAALKNLVLNIPPLNEQVAITAILSDMDAELTTLETRRDKTQSLKQGMMQELLTGRIRLV
jgi:type I restriction enzyme, S subunit